MKTSQADARTELDFDFRKQKVGQLE